MTTNFLVVLTNLFLQSIYSICIHVHELFYYREKGGAYGSGAKVGQNIFSFFSYR